jgi:hypothetical protein
MRRLEELRAKLAAGIDWREDARTMRQLLTVAEAARELAAAMKTCHICKGVVLIEEGPIHCENCTYDCEEHEPPDCVTLGVLHAKVCVALTPLLEDSEGSDANCLPTKVNTPQAGAEALEAKSLYCIPPGCICHGDGLMGMKCDAPEHARLKSEINPGSSSQDR